MHVSCLILQGKVNRADPSAYKIGYAINGYE